LGANAGFGVRKWRGWPWLADIAQAEVPFPAWGVLLIVLASGLGVVIIGYVIYKLVRKPKNYSSLGS